MPNLSTILVGLVVFGTFGAILAGELRRHKAGRGGCSCGCGSCPGHGICHRGGPLHITLEPWERFCCGVIEMEKGSDGGPKEK